MNHIAFDTHRFVKRMAEAGMPEAQAEVLAEEQSTLIANNLATKSDLTALEGRLEGKMDALRNDIKVDIAELRGEIRLNRWMLALVIAVTVIPFVRDLFG